MIPSRLKELTSLEFLGLSRNEFMARSELTIQSHALLVVRTLNSIYSVLQLKLFDGVDFDTRAAIMHLFDSMLTASNNWA